MKKLFVMAAMVLSSVGAFARTMQAMLQFSLR